MKIWTLAWDTDSGTGASVHMTERECFEELIRDYVDEENREEALRQLELDGTTDKAGEYDFWKWFDDNLRETMDTFSIESHEIDVPASLNSRELATTLYALRELQDKMHETDDVLAEMKDSGHFEDAPPLTEDEIDDLCERLNLSPVQPQRRVVVRVESGVAEFLEVPDGIETVLIDYDDLGCNQGEALESAISAFPKDLQPAIREYFFFDEQPEGEAKQEVSPEVLKARAGIIPHDPQDDEPDEEPKEEQQFRNYYRCTHEETRDSGKPVTEWHDDWSATCNDRCPLCNLENEPYYSEELTDPKEVIINPSAVAGMTDKLGTIL